MLRNSSSSKKIKHRNEILKDFLFVFFKICFFFAYQINKLLNYFFLKFYNLIFIFKNNIKKHLNFILIKNNLFLINIFLKLVSPQHY